MSSAGSEGIASAGSTVAQGAAMGAMVGGPVGAAVGGVVGAVAGIFGIGSSKRKRKAARLKRQAAALQNVQLRRQAIVEYIQAQSVAVVGLAGSGAGTGRSSGVGGVQASLRTQVGSNLKLNSELYQRGTRIDELDRKAAKGSMIQSGIMTAFEGLVNAGGLDFLNSPKKPTIYGSFEQNYARQDIGTLPPVRAWGS